MSIKKKMTLSFVGIICFFLVTGNILTFTIFKKIYIEKVMSSQQTNIYNNIISLNLFFDSLNHVCLQMAGDHVMGELLSKEYESRSLDQYQAQSSLTQQVIQSTNILYSMDTSTYTSIFFVNDKLPLASSLNERELREDVNNISGTFKNTLVKDTDWYKNAVLHNDRFNVFVNDKTHELYMAKRINNAYYTGPRLEEGIGVIVIILDSYQLETIFKLSRLSTNASFLLINTDPSIIYTDQNSKHAYRIEELVPFILLDEKTDTFADNASLIHEIAGKKYVVNLAKTGWGLYLMFLTPYSYISSQLAPVTNYIVISSLLLVLLCILSVLIATRAITGPILQLTEHMASINDSREVEPEIFLIHKKDEIGKLYGSFSQLLSRNNQLLDDVEMQTAQKKEAELKALQAQINPHFVFNAMDVVNWIALSREQDDIADIVNRIASIMRYSITNPDNMVHLFDELFNLENYMMIQEMRFGSRIRLILSIPEKFMNIKIPKFIIQPLVENAIHHGMYDSQTCITIEVSAVQEGQRLILRVADDGKGCDILKLNDFIAGRKTNLKVSNGFGVRNVNDRILLKFGGEGGMYYCMDHRQRFTAVVVIPMEQKNCTK